MVGWMRGTLVYDNQCPRTFLDVIARDPSVFQVQPLTC